MRTRLFGALAALSLTLFPLTAGAQVIYDEYNAADLAAGVTAYSGPDNGSVAVDRFLARHTGLFRFNWQALAGVRAGQPIWCSTKMRLSDMVREKFATTMVQYQFLCRAHFNGMARYLRIAFGPPEQAMMSFTDPYLGVADASVPAMHWYDAMFGAGWFPGKNTDTLTAKATHPKSLGCGSLKERPAPNVRVVEWSFCKHALVGQQYSIVLGVSLRKFQDKILYITYAGVGMFQVIPLETLVAELAVLLKDVQYVELGS